MPIRAWWERSLNFATTSKLAKNPQCVYVFAVVLAFLVTGLNGIMLDAQVYIMKTHNFDLCGFVEV